MVWLSAMSCLSRSAMVWLVSDLLITFGDGMVKGSDLLSHVLQSGHPFRV